MIRRAKKWIVRVGLLLLAVCILFIAAVVFVLNTKSGTAWTIARIDAALPGELDTSQFEGTLWQGLEFEQFIYADESQRVEVDKLKFRLNWPSVITGRAALETVYAKSIRRTGLQPALPEPQPFELGMEPLPVVITIAGGSVDELVLVSGNAQQNFNHIRIEKLRISGSRFQVAKAEGAEKLLHASVEDFAIVLADDVRTSGKVSWQMQDGSWSGRGAVRGTLAELEFQQDVAGLYPASVSGTVHLLNRLDPEFDVLINWGSWPVSDLEILDGEIRLHGVASQFTATYDATIALDEQQRYGLSGSAIGNAEGLSEFESHLVGQAGEANLSGTLTWLPEFAAEATANVTNIDPAEFRPELSGKLDATANLAFNNNGELSAKGFTIAGILNDAPVRGGGDIRVSAGRQQCLNCEFFVADNRLSVNGSNSNDGLSLSVSLDAPTLRELWPVLGGAAVANAQIEGPINSLRVVGDATLEGLSFDDAELGVFVVSWRGSLVDGEASVNWRFQDLEVVANGELQYKEQELSGVVRDASLAIEQLGQWNLVNEFSFNIADQNVSVDRNDWSGALGELDVSHLSLTDDTLRVGAVARNLPLELGNRLLPKSYQLSGFGNANVDLTRQSGEWSGNLHWEQADTLLRVSELNEEVTEVVISRAEVDVGLVDGGVIAKANIGIDPGVTGALNLTLDRLSPDTPMTARLQLQGDDWSWVSAVVPQIDRFDGAIEAGITANGRLNAPEFSGNAEWRDGRLTVPSTNVSFEEIGVVISGAPNGEASIIGSAKAGDGRLVLDGQLSNLMQATRSASFKITGDGAELTNWPEYHIWGSPDIELTGDADAWHIEGNLDVPRANIELREVPVGAVTLSPDVVVLGEEDKVAPDTRLTANARLRLGERVRFEGLGLDARLDGDLLFKLADGRPLSAEGRLSLIDGSYEVHGQKLKIEQGELTFTGPLDDPIVDVRAVRVIETFDGTVKAGIRLRGRAQNLTSSVYSEPAMADSDALSYLVIGRPLNQATESEGRELSGAAFALGLRQAARITDQIGQTLGLDQLALSGDGSETMALVAGKQINSRLHARYAYDVFSSLGTLLLRYRMSSRLTLEAGAGENQSIDVLYSVEK
jgi:translocation and assembly module TamB